MKILVFLFLVSFAFSASAQTPFMVCKPGGYSNKELKDFLFEEDEYGNMFLKQDTFVQNYAFHSARVLNDGYLKCKIDYWITPSDLYWAIDSSYVRNLDMKHFINSEKVGNNIEFFPDTFSGGVRIHEYLGCQVPWMKDTCANIIEYQLPKLSKLPSGIVQNKKPNVGNGNNAPTPNGGKEPEVKSDTFFIPGLENPIITSSGKKGSWQQEEYEKQQKVAIQGIDSLGAFSQTGSTNYYIVGSFNTTNVLPSGQPSQPQDDSDGQFVYYRDSWVPASSFTDLSWYDGPRVGFRAGVRFLWGVNNYSYCPTGIPSHAYWDGKNVRSALDNRTLESDSRGNWQYTRSLSSTEWANHPLNTTPRGETTGYNSDSYHPATHQRPVQNIGHTYGGPRRRT